MEKYLNDIKHQLQKSGKNTFTSGLSRSEIVRIIKGLQQLLFPDIFYQDYFPESSLFESIYFALRNQIEAAFKFSNVSISTEGESEDTRADELTTSFFAKLPEIRERLERDVQAIYEGDPAAKSSEEIMICYPGFYAICIYRMAHELYTLQIPLISRIMTEYAHEKTGIDIHAGATIGDYFCIDHGTGIVIGETTVIGHHVKLYQGVTLGAKSFELDADGNPVKGIKRHPNIGNHCIIYANATILGGETYVGDNSVIGGNTWLIKSIAPGSVIYNKPEHETK